MKRFELELTDKELDYLVAATTEFFHKMKSAKDSEIYGAFIADTKVLTAKKLWSKVEHEAVKLTGQY